MTDDRWVHVMDQQGNPAVLRLVVTPYSPGVVDHVVRCLGLLRYVEDRNPAIRFTQPDIVEGAE